MEVKRISRTVLSGIFVEFLNKIAPLVIIFVIQRRIGVESFGYAMFGISMVELFIPLVVFGYSHFGSLRLAEIRNDSKKSGLLISNIIALRLLHAMIVTCIFSGSTFIFDEYHNYQTLALWLSFSFFAASCEVMWVFMATQAMATFNLCIGIGRLISLCLILVMVRNQDHGLRYAVLSLFSNAMINVITFYVISRRHILCRPNWSNMTEIFRKSASYALILGLSGFLDRIDMLLIENSGGAEAAGFYAGPARIAHSLSQISNAIILTFFSEMVVLRESLTIRKHLYFGTLILISWCSPLIVGGYFVGEELLITLFGQNFGKTKWVFLLLLINMLIGSLILAFGMQILILHKKTKYLSLSLFAGGLFILLLFFLAPLPLHSEDIATMALAGKFLVLALVVFKVRGILEYFPWKAISTGVLPSLVMGLILFILPPDNFFMTLIWGALVCLLSTLLIHWKKLGEISRIWKS